jgi:hypothetical protein
MPKVTARDPGRETTAYTSRNLYVDLLDRVRVLAAVDKTTMEDAMNYLLERGLEADQAERTRVLTEEGGA